MSSLSVESLLGGREVLGHGVESEIDMYELGKEGIPKKSLLSLAASMDLSMRAMARILHIAERTLQRKQENDLLGEEVSEHVIQLAEVYSRGAEVIGDSERFRNWLNAKSAAFGDRSPIEMLSSRYGAQMVLDELGRMEHGVVA
jgi:putative toxin-antitoxin system antitoxin component (TIGR02293 family)